MSVQLTPSPVKVIATDDPDQPARTPELEQLYRDFEANLVQVAGQACADEAVR